jgi:ECF sigma factor
LGRQAWFSIFEETLCPTGGCEKAGWNQAMFSPAGEGTMFADMGDPHEVTLLLSALTRGDEEAGARLIPFVYDELRRLAGSYMRRERADHTLEATALVHEAYLKLVEQKSVNWQNRAHFFGVAAQLMRRILIDHARGHQGSS